MAGKDQRARGGWIGILGVNENETSLFYEHLQKESREEGSVGKTFVLSI